MPKPGRHIEGARTRERVLEAAADLIARQGYAATSIAQISQRSGSNPASIYWAFGSKEGLLAAVMERAADAFFAQLEPPREGDVVSWLAVQAETFASGPEFLRLLLVLSLAACSGAPGNGDESDLDDKASPSNSAEGATTTEPAPYSMSSKTS